MNYIGGMPVLAASLINKPEMKTLTLVIKDYEGMKLINAVSEATGIARSNFEEVLKNKNIRGGQIL